MHEGFFHPELFDNTLENSGVYFIWFNIQNMGAQVFCIILIITKLEVLDQLNLEQCIQEMCYFLLFSYLWELLPHYLARPSHSVMGLLIPSEGL